MPAKVKPVHQIRLGNIKKAAIWENITESGRQFNVTFERLFKNGDEVAILRFLWKKRRTCSSSAKWLVCCSRIEWAFAGMNFLFRRGVSDEHTRGL